jgi:hypothetical protein
MPNLNPTFKKELKDKKIVVDFLEPKSFKLTPYELNQIRFWINLKHDKRYNLPTILPVSKRFCLDFVGWENPQFNDVLLVRFKKVFFHEF